MHSVASAIACFYESHFSAPTGRSHLPICTKRAVARGRRWKAHVHRDNTQPARRNCMEPLDRQGGGDGGLWCGPSATCMHACTWSHASNYSAGDDEYKDMVCIEAAAVERAVTVAPGATWEAGQTLTASPM